jgi:hypothetical protein
MSNYDIALIVTIDAGSYDHALRQADALAEGVGYDGENIAVVTQYAYDGEGRRVVYLPKID